MTKWISVGRITLCDSNRRFEPVANCFDKRQSIFAYSAALSGSQSGGGLVDRQVLCLFRTRDRELIQTGKGKKQ
jgi:hypothetical protein